MQTHLGDLNPYDIYRDEHPVFYDDDAYGMTRIGNESMKYK